MHRVLLLTSRYWYWLQGRWCWSQSTSSKIHEGSCYLRCCTRQRKSPPSNLEVYRESPRSKCNASFWQINPASIILVLHQSVELPKQPLYGLNSHEKKNLLKRHHSRKWVRCNLWQRKSWDSNTNQCKNHLQKTKVKLDLQFVVSPKRTRTRVAGIDYLDGIVRTRSSSSEADAKGGIAVIGGVRWCVCLTRQAVNRVSHMSYKRNRRFESKLENYFIE